MPDDQRPDLSLYTVGELFEEIRNRVDMALLVWKDEKDYIQMQWSGFHIGAIGLADYSRRKLYELLKDETE